VRGNPGAHGSGAQDSDFIDPLMAGLGIVAVSLSGSAAESTGLRDGRNGNITHLGHLLELVGAGE
jgi:hypothetical protein